MIATLWGTRGSLAAPGPETMRYGGNTSCVEVRGADGTLVILDSGTGIRRLGETLGAETRRIDLLLTHLHMDHIQGLGFFDPLFEAGVEVHIWGPSSATQDLGERLVRYLSPPLFPVYLRNVPCRLTLHDVVSTPSFRIGGLEIEARLVCHPGPTVGYRIREDDVSLAYLPDHEPALGGSCVPIDPEWLSGHELAAGVDLLIHDAQYTDEEYATHVGWGHSSVRHALEFAKVVAARQLVCFHHDPAHSDTILDRIYAKASASCDWPFQVTPGTEGASFKLGRDA